MKKSMQQDINSMFQTKDEIFVPSDLFAFEGHFPGNPIVPGIYSLELAVQCVAKHLQQSILLKKVNKCKFHRPVLPGMKFRANVSLKNIDQGFYKAKIRFVDGGKITILEANIIVEEINGRKDHIKSD